MDSYHISGGKALDGEYRPRGAKNAVLPILAATIVSGKTSRIKNCPRLSDIQTMIEILETMGCKVLWDENDIIVDSSFLTNPSIPQKLMKKIRSSVFLMGPTLARCGEVKLSNPGGCAIGERPIDLHLNALRLLGVDIKEEAGFLICKAKSLKANLIPLAFPSVGATENAMMTALMAEGETVIVNAAREPEIVDLQNYLTSCGAHVAGAGSERIVITGGIPLHETEYRPIPDRIEVGTLLIAAAATGGQILLNQVEPRHLNSVTNCLREAGCIVEENPRSIRLKAGERLKSVGPIKTEPYPGFPTDMQSQFMTLMSVAEGTSQITESIFENRFKHVPELKKMGADIKVYDRKALIKGVKELKGNRVAAKDLRGGTALVIGGLIAKGTTVVENIGHIDRGHEKLEETLRKLGAEIERVAGENKLVG